MDSTYYFVDIIYKLITSVIVKIMGKEEYIFLEINIVANLLVFSILVSKRKYKNFPQNT